MNFARTGRLVTGTLVAGALGAVALGAFPAVARGAAVAVTTVSCSVTGSNWCISGNDSSSGIGVIGTSKSGTGLRGTSTSQNGLKATSSSGNAILAQTTTGSYAISATAQKTGLMATSTNSGIGVYGQATNGGTGVKGESSTGYGVYGTTTSGNAYGVFGYASGSGSGVYGASNGGNGMYATSSSGTALVATSGTGSAASFSSSGGFGVIAKTAKNPSVYASNSNGNGTDINATYIALLGRTPSSGYPIVATDPTGNTNLFYVDGDGNVAYKGGLNHFASVGHRMAVKSFSPDATEPIVEDTGTARLVNGAASVRLEPTFATSIQAGNAYRVFVTPNGDTRGLFVATKTAGGFIVREAQGGRSTVTFDYRIVATALGRTGQRMTMMSEAPGAQGLPRALPPVVPSHATAVRLPAAPAIARTH